jgi:CTP synthase (UTP-ammonia lyase)
VSCDNFPVIRIRIIGDYEPRNVSHTASTAAVEHAAASLGVEVDVAWIATPAITSSEALALRDASGLLIAPGSPYRSMDGALFAITHARTRNVPLLGTCGGFQHLVVEFSRNVLGIRDAEHAESSPDAPTHVITALSCSLFGQRMEVEIVPGTRAHAAYRRPASTERYYCNFGLNPEYVAALVGGGLVVSGTDQEGEVRILEHPGHPFFVGTLFVPQTSSAADAPHPLVGAFVAAAAQRERRLNASIKAIAPAR